MGHVYADIKAIGKKANHDLKSVMVDTGATYTILPKDFLEEIGADLMSDDNLNLRLANDEKIKGEAYALAIVIGERRAPVIAVTFDGALPAIGVLTLEALGLKVNPVTQKLEEERPPGLAYL